MESVLKLLQHNNGRSRDRDVCGTKKDRVDGHRILEEIQEVSRQMAYNECWFQVECDHNLIDACIYQREELSARYRYLLELAKNSKLNVASFQE